MKRRMSATTIADYIEECFKKHFHFTERFLVRAERVNQDSNIVVAQFYIPVIAMSGKQIDAFVDSIVKLVNPKNLDFTIYLKKKAIMKFIITL